MNTIQLEDFDYVTAALCNAYYNNVSLEQILECLDICENGQHLDAAIEALIHINDIVGHSNG